MRNIVLSTNAANKLELIQLNDTRNILKVLNSGVLNINKNDQHIESDDFFVYKVNKKYNIVYTAENNNLMVIDIENRDDLKKNSNYDYEKILNAIIKQSKEQEIGNKRTYYIFRLFLIFVLITLGFSFGSIFIQNAKILNFLNIGLIISCTITILALFVYWNMSKRINA